MFALLHSLAMFVIDFFKSPRRLEAENLFLRHQLSIALRRAPSRLRLRGSDRGPLFTTTCLFSTALFIGPALGKNVTGKRLGLPRSARAEECDSFYSSVSWAASRDAHDLVRSDVTPPHIATQKFSHI